MKGPTDFEDFQKRKEEKAEEEAQPAAENSIPAEKVVSEAVGSLEMDVELKEKYPNTLKLLRILMTHKGALELLVTSKTAYYGYVKEFEEKTREEFLDFLELFPKEMIMKYIDTKPDYCLALLDVILKRIRKPSNS